MIQLYTLGAVDLRRDGAEVRSVLSQPKRLALLAYLASAQPRGFHSRDTLLALFWPEADAERARSALRQALHYLRRSLGEEAVVGRNDREVGVDPDVVWCDAAAFDQAIEEGRHEEALELYRGELLPGFFIEEAPEAERWLEGERARRRQAAVEAAWALAERDEQAGELRASALWARRAVALEPLDEASLRRLLALLDRSGQPAAALEVFAEFARRLEEEYGLPPGAETVEMAERIRSPVAPRPAARSAAAAPVREADPPPEPPAAAARMAAVPAPAAVAAGGRRSAGRVVAVAVAAALVAGGSWLAVRARSAPAPAVAAAEAPSIAVLPFLNLSGDPAYDYFSDGITEELLNLLAQVPELRVASRTGSFGLRGSDLPMDSVGRLLRVGHVLEGSVRKDGERVRITAQLIDARTGYHLWSRTYDRDLESIFAVQDEISRAIADQLHVELRPRAETADPEAYALMLKANYVFNQGSTSPQDRYARAIGFLTQAVERDPQYADAYAKLADATQMQAYRGYIPKEEGYERARTFAERALELDPTQSRPHSVLGTIAEFYDWDFAAAERHYRRSVELWPGPEPAPLPHAFLLLRLGRTEEAVAAARQAAAVQPDWPGAHNNLGAVLSMAGRYEEALEAYAASEALSGGNPNTLIGRANTLTYMGRAAEAVEPAERARQIMGDDHRGIAILASVYARAGRRAEAEALLRQLEGRPGVSPYAQAVVHASLGNRDRAFELLEQAVQSRDYGAPGMGIDRSLDGLRDDPRMGALLRRVGLR